MTSTEADPPRTSRATGLRLTRVQTIVYPIGYSKSMERMVLVSDADLGTIAAVIDAEGSVVSTGVNEWENPPTSLKAYIEAADLAARELAALYAEANPEHAEWLRRMWDETLAEGGAR